MGEGIELNFEAKPTVNSARAKEVDVSKYDFLVNYHVDARHSFDVEVFDIETFPLRGTIDGRMYFYEVASEASIVDWMPDTKRVEHDPDNGKFSYMTEYTGEPGIFIYMLGVRTFGSSYETSWGTEYDAWEEYDVLSVTPYSEKETARYDRIVELQQEEAERERRMQVEQAKTST